VCAVMTIENLQRQTTSYRKPTFHSSTLAEH
jgi:hypothetical protein